MSLKLFAQSDSPTQAQKILAVAKLAGVQLELPSFQEADVQAKSASGKLPVLETSQGVIFEANSIARYVAQLGKGALNGENAFETASIDQWVEFATNEIDLPASVWTFPILGYIQNNAAATSKAKADVRKVFEQLNKFLATRTYLVGHRVTLADISVAASLVHLYKLVLDTGFRKAFGNVNRWFTTIVNQPAVAEAFGAVALCEKAQVAPETAPKAAEEKPKEAEKPKAKKEEKPKEDKPKPKPKDDDEEEENFEDEAPKGKNPLDQLPPSTMVMDEWKRMYSNNDTVTVAQPWLWQHLDEEGYSLWFCKYKYPEELTKVFMTANLIGGFLQRLDKLRKYGFGCMLIFGADEQPQSIEGAWLVRGKVVPPELAECDDYELYDWKQVDTKDESQKQLLNDFFAWEGKFEAREKVWGAAPKATEVNQGKTFK